MRRLVEPDYGQPGNLGDLHSPRKVGKVFADLLFVASLSSDVHWPGECWPAGGVERYAQDAGGERFEARQKGVHPHGDAVRPVP